MATFPFFHGRYCRSIIDVDCAVDNTMNLVVVTHVKVLEGNVFVQVDTIA